MSAKLRALVQYGVTPIFLFMAGVNFLLERRGAGHQHGAAMKAMDDVSAMGNMPPVHTGFVETLGHFGFGSMWLMYVLMGLAHISPYLPKSKNK